MASKIFSLAQALRFGLYNTFDHFVLFIGVLLTGLLINVLRYGGIALIIGSQVIFALITRTPGMEFSTQAITAGLTFKIILSSLLLYFLFKIVDSLYVMGISRICLDIYDTGESSYAQLFCCLHLVVYHIIASILFWLMVAFGLILLIIPGLIMAIKFWFFQFFIVDEQVGPLEALQKSSQLVDGHKLEVGTVLLILILINMAAAWAFGIGLILTIPLSMLTQAYVYRKLQLKKGTEVAS